MNSDRSREIQEATAYPESLTDMKNTLENKAKFFAQYYGQEILTRDDGFRKFWKLGDEVSIESALSKHGYNYGYYLELKPLSQITDEDAISFMNIYSGLQGKYKVGDLKLTVILSSCPGETWKRLTTLDYSSQNETGQFFFNFSNHDFSPANTNQKTVLKLYDFLRSKGYALPWMDLSVEQLIEYGWVKLKG